MKNEESKPLLPRWQIYSLLITFNIGLLVGGYFLPKEVESKTPPEFINIDQESPNNSKT